MLVTDSTLGWWDNLTSVFFSVVTANVVLLGNSVDDVTISVVDLTEEVEGVAVNDEDLVNNKGVGATEAVDPLDTSVVDAVLSGVERGVVPGVMPGTEV